MTNPRGLTHLAAWDAGSGLVNVVVEAPRGSRNKYKYDERHGLFRLSKVLPLGACFPYDFGFIPSTRAEDGDPVDVLVLTEEPAFAGCVLPVRLLGVIEAEQTEGGKTVPRWTPSSASSTAAATNCGSGRGNSASPCTRRSPGPSRSASRAAGASGTRRPDSARPERSPEGVRRRHPCSGMVQGGSSLAPPP